MHAAVDPSAAATSHQLFALLVIHLISLVSAHCAQHVQGLRKGDGDALPPSGQLCSSPPKSKIQHPPPNFLFSPVHSFPSPSAPYHRLLRAGSWANTKLTPDVPTALASAQSRASKQAILQIAIPPQLQHSDLPLLLPPPCSLYMNRRQYTSAYSTSSRLMQQAAHPSIHCNPPQLWGRHCRVGLTGRISVEQ